jgi:hypothetical protein
MGSIFTVTVNPATTPPLTVTPPGGTLPNETVGTQVNDVIATVSGGTPPYSPTISGGSLPPGVSMTAQNNPDGTMTLIASGTPTTAGTYTFTLTVTDAAGGIATAGKNPAAHQAPPAPKTPWG